MLSADENETYAFAITADNIVIGSVGILSKEEIKELFIYEKFTAVSDEELKRSRKQVQKEIKEL